MKALVISDIHGNPINLEKIKSIYNDLKCQKLIVLGDIYWKSTPYNYNPNEVRRFLKLFSKNLICIKGNCDFKIDLTKEPFKIEKDNIINIEKNIYITHGHIYNENNWPISNSILIFGHYHYPFIKKIDSNIYINPGSISIQRSNHHPSYLLIDEDDFTIYDINGSTLAKLKYSELNMKENIKNGN